MRYLIVCGGKIDKEFGLNEIKTDGIDAIIAADSGMDFLYENGVTPDIIVGDFDSARQMHWSILRERDRLRYAGSIP